MDFANYTPYPTVLKSDSSDMLDEAYLADAYATSPDSLSNFFDCDSYFNRPSLPLEAFTPKNSTEFTSTLPTTSASAPAPFGQLQYFPSGFSFDALEESPSPQLRFSQTPPITPHALNLPHSPPHSPKFPTEHSSPSPSPSPPPNPRTLKRGRPRISHVSTTSPSSTPNNRVHRVSHNQVERKYRENLNASLERLRQAIPTLSQTEEGQPKPSKAVVLASAIEYIARIERERDLYREECERLRGL